MQSILDFIIQNWLFLSILIVSILAILSLYYVFNLHSAERPKRIENVLQPDTKDAPSTIEIQSRVEPIEPVVVGGEIIVNPGRHAESTMAEPEPQLALNASEPPIVEVKQEEPDKPNPPKPKKTLGRYHVLYRAVDDSWIVKREGSDRILRVLETQKDAIAFANIKALSNNTQIVIHKKDGKIRKQNYRKSDEN
jgi:hypothetical protein